MATNDTYNICLHAPRTSRHGVARLAGHPGRDRLGAHGRRRHHLRRAAWARPSSAASASGRRCSSPSWCSGSGLFFALDTFVAQSFGAGRIAGVSSVAVRGARAGRRAVGRARRRRLRRRDRSCRTPASIPTCWSCCSRTSRALLWSAPPLFLFTVFRRYLQAMNIVRPILVGVVVMNLVNAFGNWVFVYGHLGMPAMGAVGSAYATVAARVALAMFLWVVIVRGERRRPSGLHDVADHDRHRAHVAGSSGSERRRHCSSRSKSACLRPRRRWPAASRPWRLPPTRWC